MSQERNGSKASIEVAFLQIQVCTGFEFIKRVQMCALSLTVFLCKLNLIVTEYLAVKQSRIMGSENQLALHVLVCNNT